MQLLDGSVRVYEQDLFAFERVLVAETVVPGTLTYCGDLDSFVVGETDGRVMALPYGTVRGSTGDGTLAGTANAVAQTCVPEWTVDVGESVRSVMYARNVARHSPDPSQSQQQLTRDALIVLGSRSVLFIKPTTGHISASKAFEHAPICCCVYPQQRQKGASIDSKPSFTSGLLVLTANNVLSVLRNDQQLLWAAHVDQPHAQHALTVQLAVHSFAFVPALIVTLSDQGHLTLSYLGTRTHNNNKPINALSDLPQQQKQQQQQQQDFSRVASEMTLLQRQISQQHQALTRSLSQLSNHSQLRPYCNNP